MAITYSPDPFLGSIQPSQKQQALESNYLNFTNGDDNNFAQQYLPEIYEAEVERYGNRTLSGFLRMVGAEMPMSSDQVVWSEQNRLHISYENVVSNALGTTLTIAQSASVQCVISPRATIVIMNPATGAEVKALVDSVAGAGGSGNCTITVFPYTQLNLTAAGGGVDLSDLSTLKIFVYGSEYAKGTRDDDRVSVTPQFTQYSNSPIIIKDKFAIAGSDTSQIGWVEIATEDGAGGYLWYLKAESETRLRFEDYLEMSVVEGELKNAASGAGNLVKGTEGLFAAVKSRGNVVTGFAGTGETSTSRLASFDEILKNLDTQGAIEENMLFLNRATSLDFDDMLAGVGAGATYGGGSSYGVFENSEDMALNLDF